MAPAFNPFAASRTKHSKEHITRIFGPKANGKEAQELFRRNPQLYQELRRDAQVTGLIGDSSYTTLQTVDSLRMNQQQELVSDEVIRARAHFSKEECQRLYTQPSTAGTESVDSLRKNDPERYHLLKLAAESHGVIGKSSVEVRVVPRREHIEPTQPPDDSFLLTDEQADKLFLPRGHRCASPENFGHLVELAEQLRAEVKNGATAVMAAVAAEK